MRIEPPENGIVRLRLHGVIGATCVLDTSENLFTWQPISTNTITVGGIIVIESAPEETTMRFYRLRTPLTQKSSDPPQANAKSMSHIEH